MVLVDGNGLPLAVDVSAASPAEVLSWLQVFRRLVTRYEFYARLFHSFAKLACLMIVLRRF